MIATGVRDVGAKETHYEIVDFGIAGSREWIRRFSNSPFTATDADQFCKVIFAHGGTGALLKQNLVDRDLDQYVKLIVLGDFIDYKTERKYNFVFCDCTHDEIEIRRNVPVISKVLREDCIFICDDIHNNEQLELIRDLSNMECAYLSNSIDQYSKFGIFTRGIYKNIFG